MRIFKEIGIAVIIIAFSIGFYLTGFYDGKRTNVNYNLPISSEAIFDNTWKLNQPTSKDQLKQAVENLPDSLLKSNLLHIIGIDMYEGSAPLNELLTIYSKMKLKEIQQDLKPDA